MHLTTHNAINKFIKPDGKSKEIEKTLDKMIVRHFKIFHKFCDTAISFINFVMY